MRRIKAPSTRYSSVLLAGGVLILGACDTDSPTERGPTETNQVTVADDFFEPLTAVVSPGTQVTWTWAGRNPHDVVWDDAGLPNSDLQSEGTHDVTMPEEPGAYRYHCTVHGNPGFGMHGTIVVE